MAIGIELRRRRYGEAVHFLASDLSGEARDVATINAVSHGLAHLFTFAEGDLVDVAPAPGRPADLLVGNLPYIPSAELATLMPEVRCHEPRIALDGGPDGLDLVRRLVAQAAQRLEPGGLLALEITPEQRAAVFELVAAQGLRAQVHRDLGGLERVVTAVM